MLGPQRLLYFQAIVAHGGLSAASRALGVPKATLSRRLAALERQVVATAGPANLTSDA